MSFAFHSTVLFTCCDCIDTTNDERWWQKRIHYVLNSLLKLLWCFFENRNVFIVSYIPCCFFFSSFSVSLLLFISPLSFPLTICIMHRVYTSLLLLLHKGAKNPRTWNCILDAIISKNWAAFASVAYLLAGAEIFIICVTISIAMIFGLNLVVLCHSSDSCSGAFIKLQKYFQSHCNWWFVYRYVIYFGFDCIACQFFIHLLIRCYFVSLSSPKLLIDQ